MPTGFLNIDKPQGITSFGVVSQLRRVTGVKKIGHAGTLDPLATGVLVCAVGRETTKKIDQVQKEIKVYEAEITLGATSTTYDAEGEVSATQGAQPVSQAQIEKAIHVFVGEIEQVPPIFSAKKIGGKRAYQLARENKTVDLKASRVIIHEIRIISYDWPRLVLQVACGKGTYIRSLAHDIGQELGVGGYLTKLRRTQVGDFSIDKAVSLDQLTADNWVDYLQERD